MAARWSSSSALGLFALIFLAARRVGTVAVSLAARNVVELARRHGFPDPELAAAVALAESGGKAGAIGDHGTSFGLWQIHAPAHPQFDRNRLLEPDYNAAAALAISSNGTNWHPWTTYQQGLHLAWLAQLKGNPNG